MIVRWSSNASANLYATPTPGKICKKMILWQQFWINDSFRIGKRFAEIVMIGDDDIHAARVGSSQWPRGQ